MLPSADVVARVAVRDRDAAERELAALIARLGGSVTQRRREDETTVVEAVIPQPRYAEFSDSVRRIGTWQVEAERAGSPRPDPRDPAPAVAPELLRDPRV